MTKLAPIQLEDGTIIYIEVREDVQIEEPSITPERELTRDDLGKGSKGLREVLTGERSLSPQERFKIIEGTIKTYTTHTLSAFKEIADANINKVTLEFGIKVGGKVGIPYITEGTAESNLKITVECSFPTKQE